MGQQEKPDDGNVVKRGKVLEEFKEIDELRELIKSIPDISGQQIAEEKAHERYLCK